MEGMEPNAIVKSLDIGLKVVDMVLRVAMFMVHTAVTLFLGVLNFCAKIIR